MQNDVTQEQKNPCNCTLAGPDPACAEGQRQWKAIDSAVAHSQALREYEIPVAEGHLISASDEIDNRQDAYAYHVACQNPSSDLLLSMSETMYGILERRRARGDIAEIASPGYENRAEMAPAELAAMLAELAAQALVQYIDPIYGPQAIMPLERDLAEQGAQIARAYIWQHQKEANQEEQRQSVTFINIEPTDEGYRGMKALFSQSIERHQASIEQLKKVQKWLLEDGPTGEGPYPLVIPCIDELETMFDMKIEEINRSIESCQGGVAELERCGY